MLTAARPPESSAQPRRTATLVGTVVDAETGAPLQDVHVFLGATMLGTATDRRGRFRIEEVPTGAHRVVFSMVGYAQVQRDTLLRAGLYRFDVRLEPSAVALPEITVDGEHDRRWRQRLEKFERLFIGETPNAAQTRLVNPYVLDFESTWWGRFRAHAREPLVLENRALGYRVRYYLEEFEQAGSVLRFDGEPLFEPLDPADAAEARRWEENRQRSYLGSMRHFLQTLLDSTSADAGFVTYHCLDDENPRRSDRRFPIDAHRLLEPGPTPNERTLDFFGFLEVVYTREVPVAGYFRWTGEVRRPGREAQRSWIELNDGPALVDHTGEMVDAYAATVYGYFAYERMAELLPREYAPAPSALSAENE